MYNVSENWEDAVYSGSSVNSFYITLNDDYELSQDYITAFNMAHILTDGELTLGGTPSKTIEFTFCKTDDLPETIKTIDISYGMTIEDEIEKVPLGKFIIQEYTENDDFTITIKASDYMVLFDTTFLASELTYPMTMKNLLIAICNDYEIELGTTTFLNENIEIAVYDDSLTARTLLSYISEQAGSFAFIGRDGKLYIKQLFNNIIEYELSTDIFQTFNWGEPFTITKVAFEDGIQDFTFGDDEGNVIWINANNMFIASSEQVENIYDLINETEVYSFKGSSIIDPALDIGDIIKINDKYIIWQYDVDLYGKFIGEIQTEIELAEKTETTTVTVNETTKLRRIQSSIDQVEGTVTILATEVGEQDSTIAQLQISVEEISQKVEEFIDVTNTVEGLNSVILENCVYSNPIKLVIYGNSYEFNTLYPADDLYPNSGLVQLKVTSTVDEEEVIKFYDLNFNNILKKLGVCDELVIEGTKIYIIRRISTESDVVLDEEYIEDLGTIDLVLYSDTNTIEIVNYMGQISCKYGIQNDYTDIYTTKVELNSSINQTAESIMLEVSQKVGENEVISSINQSAEEISINANKINLNGVVTANNNFIIKENGTMECTGADIKLSDDGSASSSLNLYSTNYHSAISSYILSLKNNGNANNFAYLGLFGFSVSTENRCQLNFNEDSGKIILSILDSRGVMIVIQDNTASYYCPRKQR